MANWLYTSHNDDYDDYGELQNEVSFTPYLQSQAHQHRRMTGRVLSADDIVNIRKEPIAIDLEVHEGSPDHRNIRHAAITDIERKIAIPKDKLDHLYSVCEPESLHVKTLSEIQRERQAQGKLSKEKQKHQNGNTSLQDVCEMEASDQGSSQTKLLRRKLVSNRTIEAQLDGLDALPANLAFVDTYANTKKYGSGRGYPKGLQFSKSHDGTITDTKSSTAINCKPVSVNTRPRKELHGRNTQNTSGVMPKLEPSSSFVTLPSSGGRKTTRLKSRGSRLNGKYSQPYSENRRQFDGRLSQMSTSKDSQVNVQTSRESNDGLSTCNSNSTDGSSLARKFWNSHTSSNGALQTPQRVSLNRLHQVSDDLTGLNSTVGGPSPVNHAMTVCDVLDVSQDELEVLNTSRQIKQEPAFEPATPPDSSDDDIIWDDEIVENAVDAESNVLELHADETFSDSEYLLEKVDELLQ